MKNIIYVLPKRNFFQRGRRGSVAHASGVIRGLVKNGRSVTVVSGEGIGSHVDIGKRVTAREVHSPGLLSKGSLLWEVMLIKHLIIFLLGRREKKILIVRYAISNTFLFSILPMMFSSHTWVCEVNSMAYHHLSYMPHIIRKLILCVESRLLRCFDYVSVVSDKLKRDVESCWSSSQKTKALTIANGGPDPLWSVYNNETADTNKMRLVYFGVFQPYYDLNMVIDAFLEISQVYRETELHLHGDGPQYEAISTRIRSIDSAYAHGRYDGVGQLIKYGLLRQSDILILPYSPGSLGGIHSPIKLYEYMACGLPIVASWTGQVGDVLEDDKTALLYEVDNRLSFISKVVALLQNSNLRNDLRDNTRATYTDKYTWHKRMQALISSVDKSYEL